MFQEIWAISEKTAYVLCAAGSWRGGKNGVYLGWGVIAPRPAPHNAGFCVVWIRHFSLAGSSWRGGVGLAGSWRAAYTSVGQPFHNTPYFGSRSKYPASFEHQTFSCKLTYSDFIIHLQRKMQRARNAFNTMNEIIRILRCQITKNRNIFSKANNLKTRMHQECRNINEFYCWTRKKERNTRH